MPACPPLKMPAWGVCFDLTGPAILNRSRIFRGLLPTIMGVMSIATFVAVYETLKDVRTPCTLS